MGRFDLIIFDCDGVLVDSERISNTVFAEMLNEIGLPVTLQEMFDVFVGNSMATCVDIITTRLGSPIPDGFVERYYERTTRAFEQHLVAVEGIHDVVETLTVPFCVASSGDHNKMRTTLRLTGLLPFFQGKLISVTEVPRGKPFPDVFLYAAERNGIEPRKCAVIEDSPIGVQAGVAAGMTVFGYSKLMRAERLRSAGASITFDNMRDLPELLEPIE